VPGYNYLGPGTHVIERLSKGIQPVNQLDMIAQQHDLAYLNDDHDLADNTFFQANSNYHLTVPSYLSAASNLAIQTNKQLRKFGLDFGRK
jgi:hypothetical protein